MRLVTFRRSDREPTSVGVLVGDRVVDVGLSGAGIAASLEDLLAQGPRARDLVSTLVDDIGGDDHPFAALLDDCRLLAPVPVPNSIRDVPCFIDHMKAGMEAIGLDPDASALGAIPAYYKGNRRTVVGPDDDVVRPHYADHIDFEAEFAVVIGQGGVDLTSRQAAAHIGGFTIFNDVSARERQSVEMKVGIGPAKGKDFDTGNPLGPWVLAEPDLDLAELTFSVRVNGETWVEGDASGLYWSAAEIVSYVSQSETLYPGDVIGLGTVPGGCGLELGRYPEDGDLVELEFSELGVLRNRFVGPTTKGQM